ncbi:MAG: hypothetical protein N3B16_13020 [Candidatus Aminicenantes bacterium]|nr:hypothetical protein [Candidatus Aminicenantes bacterium]
MTRTEKPSWKVLVGTLLLTASNISLQIAASRYFAITQSHHLAFFVVSTAFLGFGISGCFLSIKTKFENLPSVKSLSLSSFLFGLTIIGCVPALNAFPFEIFELLWSKGKLINLLIINFILGLPFFFSGWTIASLTTIYASSIRYIYAADLTGAALGAFLPAILFLPHGDRSSFLIIGLVATGASLALSSALEKRLIIPATLLLLFLFLNLLSPPKFFEFRLSPYKPLNQALFASGAKHHLTRWNSQARLDIVSSPSLKFAPGLSLVYQQNLPPQFSLFIDGGHPSALTSFEHLHQPELAFLEYLPFSLPFFLIKKPDVLILEPRGGLEILLSLYFKARKIKVIENNPLILSVLKKDLAGKIGNLLAHPEIKAISAFPRSEIKKEKDFYDLIIFSLPDIMAPASPGLASLQEDHLRTRESITQLLHLLSPGGILMATLVLSPPARHELRFLATVIEAMEINRLDPSKSMVLVLSWGTINILARKGTFTSEEINLIKDWCQERLFHLAYFPGRVKESEPESEKKYAFPVDLIEDLLNPKKRNILYEQYLFDIKPACDNRPFFHQIIKLSQIKSTYLAFGKKLLPLIEGGGLYPFLFFQAIFISLVFLIFPFLYLRKRLGTTSRRHIFELPYFALIGIGFMTVEILFIQKGILFLGQPTQAFSTVLFSLLFSCGLGSLASAKWREKKIFSQGKFLLGCGLILLLDCFLFPLFIDFFFPQPFLTRLILLFIFFFPTGFFLGFAFPVAIARLHQKSPRLIPLAWSINAFSSVTTSILAIILAFCLGYSFLFIFSSLCYVLAFLFFCLTNHRDKTHS